MIDTRYYAVVSSGSELAMVVEENTIIRKRNGYLIATLITVGIAFGFLLYQNHLLEGRVKNSADKS